MADKVLPTTSAISSCQTTIIDTVSNKVAMDSYSGFTSRALNKACSYPAFYYYKLA